MYEPRVGIDFGSTGIKASWMTPGGRTKSIETIPMPVQTRKNRVIHPPDLVLKRIENIPDRFSFEGSWEAALASQRSSFILWNAKKDETLTPLISWRDRRAEPWVRNLDPADARRIREITGLRPEAGYPLPKLCWLLDEQPELRSLARDGVLRFGSLDTWIIWKASRGKHHLMDPTQASRTLFYNPRADRWSRELVEKFDIAPSMLPRLTPAFEEPLNALDVWPDATIVNTIGDQPAATIGGQPPPYEQTRVTLGTAGFVAESIEPEENPPGLALTFTPTSDGRVYQSEGVVLSAGRAVDWWIRVLGVNRATFEDFIRAPWPEDVPLWCPGLNGVGAPFWSDRPASVNMITENTSTKALCVGLVASILFRIGDVLAELPEQPQRRILLDGGLSRILHLPTMAASLWDLPTAKTLTPHLTCRGALIASDWHHPYFRGDPWEGLNLEVVLPDRDVPVQQWRSNWEDCLEDWGLAPVR